MVSLNLSEYTKARFWSKVSVLKVRQCWNWLSSVSPNGYGKFSIKNYPHSAHRISYEIFYPEFEKSLWIDHKCRNRKCVNPNHLRAVTPKINAIENSKSVCAKNSEKKQCVNGHKLNSKNIIIRKSKNGNTSRMCGVCALEQQRNRRQKARQAIQEAEGVG